MTPERSPADCGTRYGRAARPALRSIDLRFLRVEVKLVA